MTEQASVLHILKQVEQGTLSASEALLQMKLSPFDDLGFAKVDHHRSLRQGTSEVIYGAGENAGADRRHCGKTCSPGARRPSSSPA